MDRQRKSPRVGTEGRGGVDVLARLPEALLFDGLPSQQTGQQDDQRYG